MAQKQLTQKEKESTKRLLYCLDPYHQRDHRNGKLLSFFKKNVTTNDAQIEQYITPVSSKVSGFIKTIKFNENQFVHKGDTLIIIDNVNL
jgi:membrane fusion protein (multidrug efflux system)